MAAKLTLSADRQKTYDAVAVNSFRDYLRIPSVHPDVNYDDCIAFLRKQAAALQLPIRVHRPAATKPIAVITWTGRDPAAASVVLNSHMDVVPVFAENWTHRPFAADMDDAGKIYARGAQDMKCVGIQYLEAIRRLKENGVTLRRTLHVVFVPDEEIGGNEGMKLFVKSDDFRQLNVGLALDEGMANPDEEFLVYYGERTIWHLTFNVSGSPGHGSLLLDKTAGEKISHLLGRIYEMRAHERQRLENDPALTIGDVLTLNVTILKGGIQSNVIPPEFSLTLDCRIPLTLNNEKLYATFEQWCKEAGGDITIDKEQFDPYIEPTKLDSTNAFWVAFKGATDKLGLKLKTLVFPGGTDSRYIRQVGIPAIGFSPMNHTPVLLHDDDEYLEAGVFLKGVEYYCSIIPAVANVD